MKEITSIHNSYVKNVLKLQEKSRERKKQNRFIIEGIREISLAINTNFEFETVLFYPELKYCFRCLNINVSDILLLLK